MQRRNLRQNSGSFDEKNQFSDEEHVYRRQQHGEGLHNITARGFGRHGHNEQSGTGFNAGARETDFPKTNAGNRNAGNRNYMEARHSPFDANNPEVSGIGSTLHQHAHPAQGNSITSEPFYFGDYDTTNIMGDRRIQPHGNNSSQLNQSHHSLSLGRSTPTSSHQHQNFYNNHNHNPRAQQQRGGSIHTGSAQNQDSSSLMNDHNPLPFNQQLPQQQPYHPSGYPVQHPHPTAAASHPTPPPPQAAGHNWPYHFLNPSNANVPPDYYHPQNYSQQHSAFYPPSMENNRPYPFPYDDHLMHDPHHRNAPHGNPHMFSPSHHQHTFLPELPIVDKRKKKKARVKPPDDMPRRPLSAYNFFFSEEREIVLALLPDPPPPTTTNLDIAENAIVASASSEVVNEGEAEGQEDAKGEQDTETDEVGGKDKDASTSAAAASAPLPLAIDDMDIPQLQDLLSSQRLPEEEFQKLKKKINANTQRILDTHLERDKVKKSHKKSHGKIAFQKLAKLIGQRWRDIDDAERKQYYFDLAKKDLDRYNLQVQGGLLKNDSSCSIAMGEQGTTSASVSPVPPSAVMEESVPSVPPAAPSGMGTGIRARATGVNADEDDAADALSTSSADDKGISKV